MASILHWDFGPGLKIAGLVRSRFGSTVHFSPSPTIKEFFLVASFSSTSFALSAESVSIALQCCIGGVSSKFNVLQLGERSFRFSVASNKVGHFIYGLKDRIWPDFICYLSLFKKDFDYTYMDSSWHSDHHLGELSARKPMVVSSRLNFLKSSA